jgi:HlyD family secretion protein
MRLAIAAAVLAAIGVGGWLAYSSWVVPTVVVTELVEGPVVQAFYATGTLLPHREHPIKSNVEGVLVEVLVEKGASVRKDQKVALVRAEDSLMKFTQAQADYDMKQELARADSPILREFDARIAAAKTQIDVAERELARLRELDNEIGSSDQEIDRAREAVQTATSLLASLEATKESKRLELARDAKVAKAALDIAQWNLDEQTIVSPIDGVVLDHPAAVGTRLRVNDDVMKVANVAPAALVMRAAVDEEDKTQVRLGQTVKASLYSYPDRVFTGRVHEIYPMADPTRRTFEVDVKIEPPEPTFSAGMTGELAFVVESKEKAVVAPSQAVQGGRLWLVKDGRLEPVEVTVGLKSIERTEIVRGAAAGETIVVGPAGELKAGQRVQTSRVDPKAAAGENAQAEAVAPSSFRNLN